MGANEDVLKPGKKSFSMLSIIAATAPTVIGTFFGHFFKRVNARHGEAKAQLSYHEAVEVVRAFILFSSTQTLEQLQQFTSSKVPIPHWVKHDVVSISEPCILKAADILRRQFARDDNMLAEIGGAMWWTIRSTELRAEWVEMKKDFLSRRVRELSQNYDSATPLERVIFYVHGGAYFFASLETHRYQVQRHARKLGGRAFCPDYRLAPQYPFPCALLDCLASYIFLIEVLKVPRASIIFAGDSAGGGMLLSLLVILRDQCLSMPAGASLISPWVDLTHSMPSIVQDPAGDYIPPDGFHFKPSKAWPPIQGESIEVELNGKMETLRDQVQLYCPNNMLSNPLVSPINLGSLGGLPPLYIMGGSGELLRDEIMYIAHKAARPKEYPPSDVVLARYPSQAEALSKWPPTQVHLQMYDSTAHVGTTLSFTHPAKSMFGAAASFSIWAIAAAYRRQKKDLFKTSKLKHRRSANRSALNSVANSTVASVANSTTASVVSLPEGLSNPTLVSRTPTDLSQSSEADLPQNWDKDSEYGSENDSTTDSEAEDAAAKMGVSVDDFEYVAVTGREPPTVNYMIRERVSTHGRIRAMEAEHEMKALNIPSIFIGVTSSNGPIQRWIRKRKLWDEKYEKQLLALRKFKDNDRNLAEASGFLTGTLKGENPPHCSAVACYDKSFAREMTKPLDRNVVDSSSKFMSWWQKMASKQDREHANTTAVKLAEDISI